MDINSEKLSDTSGDTNLNESTTSTNSGNEAANWRFPTALSPTWRGSNWRSSDWRKPIPEPRGKTYVKAAERKPKRFIKASPVTRDMNYEIINPKKVENAPSRRQALSVSTSESMHDSEDELKEDHSFLSFEMQVNQMINGKKSLRGNPAVTYSLKDGEGLESFVNHLIADGKGVLLCNRRLYTRSDRNKWKQRAWIKDDQNEKILIPNRVLRKFALHYDVVNVYVHFNSETKNSHGMGFVTDVVQAGDCRECVGTIAKVIESDAFIFKPSDQHLPEVRLPKELLPEGWKENLDTFMKEKHLVQISMENKLERTGRIVKSYDNSQESLHEIEIKNQQQSEINFQRYEKNYAQIRNEVKNVCSTLS